MWHFVSEVARSNRFSVEQAEKLARANMERFGLIEEFGALKINTWYCNEFTDELRKLLEEQSVVEFAKQKATPRVPVTLDDMTQVDAEIAESQGWYSERELRAIREEHEAEWRAENAYVISQENRYDPEAERDLALFDEQFPYGYCGPEEAERRRLEQEATEEDHVERLANRDAQEHDWEVEAAIERNQATV